MKRMTTDDVLVKVVNNEGGFQNYKQDKGNWLNGELIGTNFGITPKTAQTAQSWGLLPKGEITEQFMRNITVEQAKNIYYHMYFKYVKGDRTPYPINYIQVDTGVLHGCKTSNKFFQRTINVFIDKLKFQNDKLLNADGILGEKSLKAFDECLKLVHPKEFCKIFLNIRLSSYSNTRFTRGWINRVNKLMREVDEYYN